MKPGSDLPEGEPTAKLGVRSEGGRRTHPLSGTLNGLLIGAGVASVFSYRNVLDGEWIVAGISIAVGFTLGMAYGLSSWWFTKFFIDETEIRIESGILRRASRRIPFARLQSVDVNQPFLARLFGLTELTLEMAGGGDSRTGLRFLRLEEAVKLRVLLLDRKDGTGTISATGPGGSPPGSTSLITKVPPSHLVLGSILSMDLVLLALFSVVGLAVVAFAPVPSGFFVGLLPFAFGAFQVFSSRVIKQWDFTLGRSDHGLRITRGLFSRSSQTIPFDRVQGVRMVEPFIWRKLGWARLDVDVAGYGISSDSDDSSTILLPIGERDLAVALIDELVPEADGSPVLEDRPDRRAAWFAPIGWKYRWLRRGEATLSSRTGWISNSTSVVPHHKVQSVSVDRGPLQRILGIATFSVHTPDGPVDVELRNIDVVLASALALDETERAKAARERVRAEAASAAVAVDLGAGVHGTDEFPAVEPTVGQVDPLG